MRTEPESAGIPACHTPWERRRLACIRTWERRRLACIRTWERRRLACIRTWECRRLAGIRTWERRRLACISPWGRRHPCLHVEEIDRWNSFWQARRLRSQGINILRVYSRVFILFLCMLFLCSCQRQDQVQAQPEQHEQFGQSEEPDAIQTILDQNVQLTEENKRLMAELEQLKTQFPEQQSPETVVNTPPNNEGTGVYQSSSYQPQLYQPPASPADAWQQIQEIANTNMVDGEQKTQFLQESSGLIKQWEEAQTAIQSQREAIDYLETIQGEEPEAIAKLADARQKITELEAIANQAQRDLDTLIAPYRKLQSLPIATPEPQYGNLAVSPRIDITPEGEFLVTIQYNKNNAVLTDTFNLNTGQGGSEQTYPPAFCRSIYRQIGRMRRANMVTWNRKVTMQEKIDFTNIITNMPRTMTANGY